MQTYGYFEDTDNILCAIQAHIMYDITHDKKMSDGGRKQRVRKQAENNHDF